MDVRNRKAFFVVSGILLGIIFALIINVFVQKKFIRAYTYREPEYRGYAAEEIKEMSIEHSYLNRVLSYNEWRICVEFDKKPNVLFWFTYRDKNIIFQGISSEPMPDKDSILEYSENFKKGTLLRN